MGWFKNLRISSKLIISFLLVAIIAGVVGIIGFVNLLSISKADTLLYEENTLGITYSSNAATFYQRLRYNAIEMALLKDDSLKNDYITKLNTFITTIDDNLEKYEDGIVNPEDRKMFDELKPQWDKYRTHMQNAINFAKEGQYEEVQNELLGTADAVGGSVQDALVRLVEYNEETAEMRADTNKKMANSTANLMVIIVLAAILIAIMLGVFISRVISNPIKKIVTAANQLAEGDMDIHFDTVYKDETGQLINAFKNLVASTKEQAALVEKMADGDLMLGTVEEAEDTVQEVFIKAYRKLDHYKEDS